MKKYVYPVILFEVGDDGHYTVLFPDLDIVASGDTVEEAYLEAEAYLKAYLEFAEKMQSQISNPSTFNDTSTLNPKRVVLLADAEVSGEYKLTDEEAEYKNFVKKYLYNTEE